MPYQIIYESGPTIKLSKKRSRFPFAIILFIIFGFLLFHFWDTGREVLAKLIFPGDIFQAREAAEAFAAELYSGVPFATALEDFCRQLMEQGSVF